MSITKRIIGATAICVLASIFFSLSFVSDNKITEVKGEGSSARSISYSVSSDTYMGDKMRDVNDTYTSSFYLDDMELVYKRTIVRQTARNKDAVSNNGTWICFGTNNQAVESLELYLSNIGNISAISINTYGNNLKIDIDIGGVNVLSQNLKTLASQSLISVSNINRTGDMRIYISPSDDTHYGQLYFRTMTVTYEPKENMLNNIYDGDIELTSISDEVSDKLYHFARYMNMRLNLYKVCNSDQSLLSGAWSDISNRYSQVTSSLDDDELALFHRMIHHVDSSGGWSDTSEVDDLQRAMKSYEVITISHSLSQFLNGVRDISNLRIINPLLTTTLSPSLLLIIFIVIAVAIIGSSYFITKRKH